MPYPYLTQEEFNEGVLNAVNGQQINPSLIVCNEYQSADGEIVTRPGGTIQVREIALSSPRADEEASPNSIYRSSDSGKVSIKDGNGVIITIG